MISADLLPKNTPDAEAEKEELDWIYSSVSITISTDSHVSTAYMCEVPLKKIYFFHNFN